MAWGEHGRQAMVMAAVVALHALFLLALLMRDSLRMIAPGSERRGPVLFFIEERPPPRQLEPSAPSTLPQQAILSNPPTTRIEPDVSGQSASPGAATADTPPLDWRAAAAQAASAVVDKAIQQETRDCDPSEKPNSFLPPCTRREHKFEWSPEQPRVGFSGGLPYVRLGERCAIGLGFFGCGFGAKPPANGELFEHMNDPERDRSSVPALDDPHAQRQHVPSMPGPDSDR